MTMTNPNEDMLEDIFAKARAATPAPADDLMKRVLADADALQPRPSAASVPAMGIWSRMLDAIGGWPAAGGLVAATVAGIWVGIAPPASVEDLTATMIGDEVSISLFPTDLMFDAGVLTDG